MSKHNEPRINHDHPAAAAWACLGADAPSSVTTLKPPRHKAGQRGVFRLHDAAGPGRHVVAKQCAHQTGLLERQIHEQILPALRLPHVGCHGCVPDGGDGLWLMLDDVGDHALDAATFSTLAAWLAQLHARSAALDAAALPDRSLTYYRRHARDAAARMTAHIANPVLTADDRHVLRQLLSILEALDAAWQNLLSRAVALPTVLIHGDLQAKNMRCRHGSASERVYVLDWEMAGRGCPLVDLASLRRQAHDESVIKTYHAAAGSLYGPISSDELDHLTGLGDLLRYIAAIDWASHSLAYAWVDESMWQLRSYSRELPATLRRVRAT